RVALSPRHTTSTTHIYPLSLHDALPISHPDSIVARLSRRDIRTTSDEVKLFIDSYHDRRSGFEFGVNPAGVKRDIAIINDRRGRDRKSTRLNSSHLGISYAVFCLKKKKK